MADRYEEWTREDDTLWEAEIEEAIRELYERVKDHPDDCSCRDCAELEILAFK